MEKVIEVDIVEKYDLIDKYNENKVCNEIIDYIINERKAVEKNITKIIVNNKCNIDKNIAEIIEEGLKRKYNESLKETHKNNIRQVIFLIIGILFIFLSTLIKDEVIWNEVLLIAGWVPIWEVIDIELFSDVKGRRKRNNINNLLKCEIIVKDIETVEVL